MSVKKLLWFALLLLTLPALGADLEFRLVPTGPPAGEIPLGAQFYVVVTGCCTEEANIQQIDGTIFLVNLQTGRNIWVPLQAQDNELIAGPVQIVGINEQPAANYSLKASEGDRLSAQTALVGGLTASAKIGPPVIDLSTPIALPGSTVRLIMRLVPTRNLGALHLVPLLPPGWHIAPEGALTDTPQGLLWPNLLAVGQVTTVSLLISIPPDASGRYQLAVKAVELGEVKRITLGVGEYLPPEVVVSHWDIQTDRLDLCSPPTIDYGQLRWATTHLGETLPYTTRPLTKQILNALAERWQKGQAAYMPQPLPTPPPTRKEEVKEEPTQVTPSPPEEEQPTTPAPEEPESQVQESVMPQSAGPLVAHWQFDEGSGDSAGDASGLGNKATLHGVSWSEGKTGNAATFDGTKSYIEAADSDSLDLSDSFTITAWINLAEVGSGRQVLLQKKAVDKSDIYTNYTLYAQWTQDALALVIGDGTRRVGYLSDKGIGTPNEWHHIAVAFGGGKVRFYIDGAPAGEETATIKPYTNNGPLVIGRYTNADNTPKFFLHGLVDDLRIYNKVLNEEEIKKLVKGG